MIAVTKGNTVSEGVDNMIYAMMSDYARSSGRIKMYETKVGKKYINLDRDEKGVVQQQTTKTVYSQSGLSIMRYSEELSKARTQQAIADAVAQAAVAQLQSTSGNSLR